MHEEQGFLQAIGEEPEDATLRLIFADWLEERGDQRGELIRLLHTLTQAIEVPNRGKLEERLRSLLALGVQPVGPFWTNSIGMEFAWIPAGVFLMGSPESEEGRAEDEYDMHGNFWERCRDTYARYPKEAVVDPHGPADDGGSYRGGQFDSEAAEVRSARRYEPVESPGRPIYVGFRPVMTPGPTR